MIYAIERSPRRMTQRVVQKHGARRASCFDDVERARHAQGRGTVRFEVPGYQTHGLMADGSRRDQQGRIDLLGLKPCDELGKRIREERCKSDP